MKTKEIKAAMKKEFDELREIALGMSDTEIQNVIIVIKGYKADNELTPANTMYVDALIMLYHEILQERGSLTIENKEE